MNGAAGGNRTHDPLLTKEVRYHYATAAFLSSLLPYICYLVKNILNKIGNFHFFVLY